MTEQLDSGGSPELAQAILHERVRVAFSKSMASHFTVLPLTSLIAWLLWDRIDHPVLIGIWIALNTIAVAGIIQVTTYNRRRPGPDKAAWWRANFTIGSAIYGVAWGVAGALLYVPDAAVAQTMLVLLLCGMAAGALTTHLTLPLALHLFHVPLLLPLALRLIAEAERAPLALAGMVVVFIAALTAIGRSGAQSMTETIRLQLRNAELVRELTGARNQLQAKSHELEQRVAERTAQLAEARQLASVGRLAAGVAHEVNNPLTWIVSNLQFIREVSESGELTGPMVPEIQPALADSIRGAARIRAIVQDLSSLAQRGAMDRGLVDIRSVLRTAVNVAHSELKRRARIDLEFGEVPPVMASQSRLAQAFLHVLLNAADAMSVDQLASNVLGVRTRQSDDGHVVAEISDTGAGIDADALEKIFDPFYTTKDPGEGTGLGLAITRNIIEELGGTIRARSEGRGATFVVTLPPAPSA